LEDVNPPVYEGPPVVLKAGCSGAIPLHSLLSPAAVPPVPIGNIELNENMEFASP
jgi:hypothetical protein